MGTDESHLIEEEEERLTQLRQQHSEEIGKRTAEADEEEAEAVKGGESGEKKCFFL